MLSKILNFFGELFITIGVILGLFIFWQTQWTTIETNNHQKEVIADIVETPEFVVAPEKVAVERRDEPPKIDHVKHGQYIAMINIPSIHGKHQAVVAEGSSDDVINMGYFGRYDSTDTYPGEIGNMSLAAHRLSYGSAMVDVEEVVAGDSVILETDKYYYVYKIIEDPIDVIVDPSQVEVISNDPYQARDLIAAGKNWIDQEPPTRRLLTITSCHPKYISSHRIIAHAEFDYWMDKADGKPKEML